ncbi:MAG TPA: MarR family transcriptional regulator [Humibacillus sp.]|nr:MarR family transcriptional regulator [Humibacillus sp.]
METDDAVDRMARQWRRERPDLDPGSMVVLARLTRAQVYATAAIERTLREFGINRGEFDVLASLRRAGEPHRLSPGALAEAMVLSPSAMTNRLERLASRGLVERRADPADGRHGIVTLTSQGRALVDRAVEAHVDTLDGLLAPLSPRDRGTLGRLLAKLDPERASAGDA